MSEPTVCGCGKWYYNKWAHAEECSGAVRDREVAGSVCDPTGAPDHGQSLTSAVPTSADGGADSLPLGPRQLTVFEQAA